jgi:hypothetical protein
MGVTNPTLPGPTNQPTNHSNTFVFEGAADTTTFMLTVNAINDTPILTEIGDQLTDEDTDFTIDLSASDVDIDENGQTLTFSAVSSDESLVTVTTTTLDNGTTGTLTFDVLDDQNGSAEITVTVTDSENGTAVETFTLTVTPVNDTPTIILPDSFTFAEDGDLTEDFSGYLSDIEEDELTLTVSGNEYVTVSIDGFVVTFGAVPDWNGTETLTFTVNDNQARAISTDEIDIIVNSVNDDPEFTSEPITSAVEDSVYNYTVNTFDVDGDQVTFSEQTLPSWLSFTDYDNGSGALTGVPDNNEVGDHNIVLRISDDNNGEADQSFTITVTNVNNAPVITGQDNISMPEETSMAITTILSKVMAIEVSSGMEILSCPVMTGALFTLVTVIVKL